MFANGSAQTWRKFIPGFTAGVLLCSAFWISTKYSHPSVSMYNINPIGISYLQHDDLMAENGLNALGAEIQEEKTLEEIYSLGWLVNLCEDSTKDIPNSESLVTTQVQRQVDINKTCSLVPKRNKNFAGHARFHQYKGNAFTILPKTGSTNLLNQICALIGENCTQLSLGPDLSGIHYFIDRFLPSVKPQEMGNTSSSNVKFRFVTVRNPWRRLVSTYTDKFIFTDEYIPQCGVYSQHRQFHLDKLKRNEAWSFSDFIERCVIYQYRKNGPAGMNEHWRPQYICGSFCSVDYNYICKLETITDDERVILHKLGATDIDKILKNVYKLRKPFEKAGATNMKYSESWTNITLGSLIELQTIYKYDFEMFNYPKHPLD